MWHSRCLDGANTLVRLAEQHQQSPGGRIPENLCSQSPAVLEQRLACKVQTIHMRCCLISTAFDSAMLCSDSG